MGFIAKLCLLGGIVVVGVGLVYHLDLTIVVLAKLFNLGIEAIKWIMANGVDMVGWILEKIAKV